MLSLFVFVFFFYLCTVISVLGNLSDIQFVVSLEKAERGVSGEPLHSPHPHPMSPARNKAAIVDFPNFTAACRNSLSPSLQQVLYAWISQV